MLSCLGSNSVNLKLTRVPFHCLGQLTSIPGHSSLKLSHISNFYPSCSVHTSPNLFKGSRRGRCQNPHALPTLDILPLEPWDLASPFNFGSPDPSMAFGLWSSGLVAFSVIMGVGTYLTGLLALVPQTCNGAQGGKIAESVGAGVLVGSCFCLILPEGFVSFLEAEDSLPEFLMGGAVLLGFLVMMLTQAISEALGNEEEVGGRKVRMTTDTQEGPSADIELVRGEMGATTSACATFSPASDSSTIRRTLPLERDFLLGRSRERSDAPSSPTGHTPVAQLPKQVLSGLLIHAAADGVAVGAASLSTNVSLTASVILAICLHKGPVSYGLTSYLRSAGLAGSMLQKGLIVFSAMTPLVAMLTYLLLSMLPGMNKQSHVALVLLFSGGAVLFVACVHILPTAMGQSGAHSHSFGVDTQTTESMRAVRLKRLAALTLGTLIPLIVAATVIEPM